MPKPPYNFQTYMVEFSVPGSLDGSTESPLIQAPSSVSDPQGIYRPVVPDNMGLVDPDYVVGPGADRRGTRGNRYIGFMFIDAATVGAPGAAIQVIDGVEGTIIVQKSIAALAGQTRYYNREGFVVPQGSLIRIVGFPAGVRPHRVRMWISALSEDELVKAQNGEGSDLDVAKDNVVIVTDTTKINFTGAGVTVANGGNGMANVNIPSNAEGGPNYVYRPGGPTSGNVFGTWAELTAALQALEGPKIVEVDDSIVAIPLIDTGNQDVNGAVFVGLTGQQQTTLRGVVGSRLLNLGGLGYNLHLQNNDPAQALYILGVDEIIDLHDGATLGSLVAAPVFERSGAAGIAMVRLHNSSLLQLGVSNPAISVVGGAGFSLVVQVLEGSVIDNDTLDNDVGAITTLRIRDFGSTVSRTQPGLAGGVLYENIQAASNAVAQTNGVFSLGLTDQRWSEGYINALLVGGAVPADGVPTHTNVVIGNGLAPAGLTIFGDAGGTGSSGIAWTDASGVAQGSIDYDFTSNRFFFRTTTGVNRATLTASAFHPGVGGTQGLGLPSARWGLNYLNQVFYGVQVIADGTTAALGLSKLVRITAPTATSTGTLPTAVLGDHYEIDVVDATAGVAITAGAGDRINGGTVAGVATIVVAGKYFIYAEDTTDWRLHGPVPLGPASA